MDLQGLLDRQPELAALFAPPAEPGAVAALQRELGLAVPDAFPALFGLADGSVGCESPYAARHLLADDGLVLHSLAEVRRWKQFWDDLARDFAALDEAERQLVFHHAFWHPDWIPLAQSGMDDVYALATTPCFGGPAHQVVRFNTKGDACWEVVSPSLAAFVELLATLLERGEPRLPSWKLAQLSPYARRIELFPITVDRFEREGVLLADVACPPPRPPTPSLGALARRAAEEHGVDEAALIERVTAAARRAIPIVFGEGRRVEASFEDETGELRLWCVVLVTDDLQRPGLEIDVAAASEVLGPLDVGDELSLVVPFRDDPTEEAAAAEQSRMYGALLAWDDDWAQRLDAWSATYRELVAEALRQP